MQRMPSPGVVLGLWVDIVLHRATRSIRKYPHTFWFGGVGPYNWQKAMDTTNTRTYHDVSCILIYSPWRGFREFDVVWTQDVMSTLANWLWPGLLSYVWGLSGLMLIYGNRCSCSIGGIRIRCVCMLMNLLCMILVTFQFFIYFQS